MEQGDQPSHAAQTGSEPHWHEYRVRYLGEIGSVLSRTLGALGMGTLIALALTLTTGIVVDEGAATELLGTIGLTEEQVETVEQTAEDLARLSLFPIMAFGLLCTVGVGAGHMIRDVSVSRAVTEAARAGAERTAVPTPQQVESITKTHFTSLWRAFFFAVAPASLILIPLMFAAMAEAPPLALLIAAFLAAVAVGYYRVKTVVEPEHQRRRITIAEHWTTEDERAAWNRARSGNTRSVTSRDAKATSARWRPDPRVRIGRRLILIAVVSGVLCWNALKIYLRLRYPEAEFAGNRARHDPGPRVEFSPEVERALMIALIIAIALCVVMIVMAITGSILEGAGRSAERSLLTTMINDPAAPRPPAAALSAHGRRHPAPLAQGLAIFAAILLVYGIPVAILGTFAMESYPDAIGVFRPLLPLAVIAIGLGTALFLAACGWNAHRSIHGRELRNQITTRWPSTPASSPRGRSGPSLTWTPDQAKQERTFWDRYIG